MSPVHVRIHPAIFLAYISRLYNKPGTAVIIVPAKIFGTWLAELTKLVNSEDRDVMQLCIFYAHGSNRYKNVDAEPLTKDNQYLLQCRLDGAAKPGQERFLVVTTSGLYGKWFKTVVTSNYGYNFTIGQLYVDEFHETKSDDAPISKIYAAYTEEIIKSIV